MTEPTVPVRSELTAGDWIGLVLASTVVLGLFTVPLVASPAFAAMFRDFGDAHIPSLTRFVLRPWFIPLLATIPLAMLAIGVARRTDGIGMRRGFIVGSFALGLSITAVYWVALYLPIFQLSNAIR